MLVEVMDTTLRDGEQMRDTSFTPEEKLSIARMLLEEVRVDRIEIASARVSPGEQEAVARVAAWAREKGLDDRIEVLGFTDGKSSVDWMTAAGARVMNLLTKGSLEHLTKQLRKTPEQHVADIRETHRLRREPGRAGERLLRGLVQRDARVAGLRPLPPRRSCATPRSAATCSPTPSGSCTRPR